MGRGSPAEAMLSTIKWIRKDYGSVAGFLESSRKRSSAGCDTPLSDNLTQPPTRVKLVAFFGGAMGDSKLITHHAWPVWCSEWCACANNLTTESALGLASCLC